MAETITSRSVLIVSFVKMYKLLTKKKNQKIIKQLFEKIVYTLWKGHRRLVLIYFLFNMTKRQPD
jgi:hypothetical protein